MKPTVDSIIAKYNISPYNGSWYVTEQKLREVLEQIIEEAYNEGDKDGSADIELKYDLSNKHELSYF